MSSGYTHHEASGTVGADVAAGKGKGKARAEDEQPMNSRLTPSQVDPHPVDPGYGLSGDGHTHQGGEIQVNERFCYSIELNSI